MKFLTNYFNGMLVESFTRVVARLSGIPKASIDSAFSKAGPLIERAAQEVMDDSGVALSGWDRLQLVVAALKNIIPSNYSEIASTVLTMIVAGARLLTLLKR